MKNKILAIIKERDNKLNDLLNEEDKIQAEYLQKIGELLPYKNKFIKIVQQDNDTIYFKVSSITVTEEHISIGGVWFIGCKSPYTGANFLSFDGYYQTEFLMRNIEKLINSIHIITKEEYLEAFKQKAKDMETLINNLTE